MYATLNRSAERPRRACIGFPGDAVPRHRQGPRHRSGARGGERHGGGGRTIADIAKEADGEMGVDPRPTSRWWAIRSRRGHSGSEFRGFPVALRDPNGKSLKASVPGSTASRDQLPNSLVAETACGIPVQKTEVGTDPEKAEADPVGYGHPRVDRREGSREAGRPPGGSGASGGPDRGPDAPTVRCHGELRAPHGPYASDARRYRRRLPFNTYIRSMRPAAGTHLQSVVFRP